jgi:hypothetical protein
MAVSKNLICYGALPDATAIGYAMVFDGVNEPMNGVSSSPA